MNFRPLSDPRSLFPSGTSALRRPRLARGPKMPKVIKPPRMKIGGVIPLQRGTGMVPLRSLLPKL